MRKSLSHQAGLENFTLTELGIDFTPPVASTGSPAEDLEGHSEKHKQWYVMRDLKRPNARQTAYEMLSKGHFRAFTPMEWRVVTRRGRRVREKVPVIRDLLFVYAVRDELDPVVERTLTLQYRYLRGGGYRCPMVVRECDMDRFMLAVDNAATPVFYAPDEVTPDMVGRRVRIVGGPLDGCEASLLKVRGARRRRIFIELPQLVAVSVEVEPEYIQPL